MQVVRMQDVPLLRAPEPASRRGALLFDPVDTGDESCSVGFSIYVPGEKAPEHQHDTCEIMIVLKGEGLFSWEGGSVTARPGTALFSPAGESHSIESTGSEDLEFIWIYAPAGGEKVIKNSWRPVNE